MKNIELQVETREKTELRKKTSRKLALLDYIPAVMYGLKKDPVSVKVKRKEISKLLKGHNISSVISNDVHFGSKAMACGPGSGGRAQCSPPRSLGRANSR